MTQPIRSSRSNRWDSIINIGARLVCAAAIVWFGGLVVAWIER